MSRCYPCDESGMCPYETFDNPDRMYFCRDNCGMGVDDDEPYIEEEDDGEELVWLSMSRMIAMGVDYEVADYLTSMGMESITWDTETDEIYCGGVLSWNSTEQFVQDVNEHKDEICI